jgi:16S rRNA (guanine1207-N2)-methyltransferase
MMIMKNTPKFESAFGVYSLQRFPEVSSQPSLRAWNAADEFLLQHLADQINSGDTQKPTKLLLLNDQFGALATHLHTFNPDSCSDSFLAQQGTRVNLNINNIEKNQVNCLGSLALQDRPTSNTDAFDWVMIRVPKTLALLEDQLHQLRPHISSNTRIVAGGMVKDIHTSTLKLFETILGETHTSLAKKKARLIFCKPKLPLPNKTSPFPTRYILENTSWTICNHANVFSRQKLDIGTRLFLEHIESLPPAKHIIDLGCGNGLLGCLAGHQQPDAAITFTDESHMAIASAKENAATILGADRAVHFRIDNCLETSPSSCADLILNNPPFHQQSVIGDHIAWQMFKDAKRVLKDNGELWVIGNRHLNYHAKLKKLFGNCRTVATNQKFVLIAATKME